MLVLEDKYLGENVIVEYFLQEDIRKNLDYFRLIYYFAPTADGVVIFYCRLLLQRLKSPRLFHVLLLM